MDFDKIPENLMRAEKLEHYRPTEAREIYLDVERSSWNYLMEENPEKDSKEMREAGLYLKKTKEAFKRLKSNV